MASSASRDVLGTSGRLTARWATCSHTWPMGPCSASGVGHRLTPVYICRTIGSKQDGPAARSLSSDYALGENCPPRSVFGRL